MNMPAVYFSHGQESGPWGTKIRAMAKAVKTLGCRVHSVDYRGIAEPASRVDKLIAECRDVPEPLILVGSSMGGHVATAAAGAVGAVGLFLLAPAFYMPEFDDQTPVAPDLPIVILHGWRDDIVPVDNSIRFARQCRAILHILDGDHRLTDNIAEINQYLLQFLQQIVDE
jgi:pimeloyl-ACP methyl ester carboxylesterase